MNYAIIRKEPEKLSFCHFFSAENIKIENDNIIFLKLKHIFLLKPLLLFFKIDKVLDENCTEYDDIVRFLLKRHKSVAVCASAEKTLSILEMCAAGDIVFYIPNDNEYIISHALERWGIAVFVSPMIISDLLLYFDGEMPHFSENTFVADFSGKYVHNTINTEYTKNISFKTYSALHKAVPNLKIQGIY